MKRYIGQTDVPLSANGKLQAEYWEKKLASLSFSHVYSSDLARALYTAQIVSGLPRQKIIVSEKLREINLGSWDGKSVSEIRAHYPKEWEKRGEDLAHYKVGSGESFFELQKRVLPYFEEIVRNKNDILIVTHAGVIRVILATVMGMPLQDIFSITQGYGALNTLQFREGKFAVMSTNVLPGPGAAKG